MNKFEKGNGMPNSPVLELQALSSDPSVDIVATLMKAKMIAVKLGLPEITEWIELELNGYPTNNAAPDYRKGQGQLKALNPFNGWIPVDLGQIDFELQKKFKTFTIIESISSVQRIATLGEKKASLVVPVEIAGMLGMGRKHIPEIRWFFSIGFVHGLINSVRQRILDWALDLEQKGILGEGLRFSQKEKEAAPMTVHNITNIHGNINNAGVIGSGNGDITQNNSITTGDFNSLEKQLKEWGVSDEDVRTLHQAVQESPVPTSADNFGSRIGEWLGNTIGKAYAGTLRIAGSAAPVLLTNAICHYYGIPV
ncbi:abortive phage resistance protein [Klebsiella pneumoniae]|uniref:AbiTii domain-containing protein n=1 Tax=Klebsiella pneumoniae TaxID=573 RepID=UPI0025579C86|nr:abortive phage resistance protein [Klebsiella pneumoniae]MEC5976048.1 abortive phage resistance protein [Klebsiella pneumoniae]